MKIGKDKFSGLDDLDREWIHTEVLSKGKKKSGLTNIIIGIVVICAIGLIFVTFRNMLSKDDLSNLENLDKLEQEEQERAAQIEEAKKNAEEEAAKKVEEETLIYIVESGDTLAGIGLEFDVDYKEIAKANGLSEPYALEIGQELKIPGVKKEVAPPEEETPVTDSGTYTVQAGDTLAGIGETLGISWLKIAEVNDIEEPYALEVGQVLNLPTE